MTAYKWKPIEDLPNNWRDFANSELNSLPAHWQYLRSKLQDSQAIEQFNTRLNREWAIETGIIEDVYRIDRGTTETLIDHGIKASLISHDSANLPAERIVEIITAQQEALDGVFAFVKQDRELSTSFIKELHSVLTREQHSISAKNPAGQWVEIPLLHGDWKTRPNNPTRPDGEIHEFCPPEHTAAEMDHLIEMHQSHIDVPVEIESAWLHHRFTQIHPFQDGNGRVARAIASVVSIKAGWFPLLIRRTERAEYIEALENADAGHLHPLVSLFARRHIETFNKAREIAARILSEEQAYSEIAESLTRPFVSPDDPKLAVFKMAEVLIEHAAERFQDSTNKLSRIGMERGEQLISAVEVQSVDTHSLFAENVDVVGTKFRKPLDTNPYRASVRLNISSRLKASIVVVFTSYGSLFSGHLAASAFLEVGEGEQITVNPIRSADILGNQLFAFSYEDDLATVKSRFGPWIDDTLVSGLKRYAELLRNT